MADGLRVVPLSWRVLEKRFRAELGRSPHEEIVARVGFVHPGYVHNVFKRETGVTPGAFRRHASLTKGSGRRAAIEPMPLAKSEVIALHGSRRGDR